MCRETRAAVFAEKRSALEIQKLISRVCFSPSSLFIAVASPARFLPFFFCRLFPFAFFRVVASKLPPPLLPPLRPVYVGRRPPAPFQTANYLWPYGNGDTVFVMCGGKIFHPERKIEKSPRRSFLATSVVATISICQTSLSRNLTEIMPMKCFASL